MPVEPLPAVMPKGLPCTFGGPNPPLGSPSGPEPSSLGDTSNLADEKTCLQALAEFIKSVFKMIVDFGRSIIFSNPLVRLLRAVIYRSNVVEQKGSTSAARSNNAVGSVESLTETHNKKVKTLDEEAKKPTVRTQKGNHLSRKNIRKRRHLNEQNASPKVNAFLKVKVA